MGWGASGIDPAGKAVVTGAYAPAVREVRRVQYCMRRASLFFFFARIVAFWWGVIDNGVRNEVMADVDV